MRDCLARTELPIAISATVEDVIEDLPTEKSLPLTRAITIGSVAVTPARMHAGIVAFGDLTPKYVFDVSSTRSAIAGIVEVADFAAIPQYSIESTPSYFSSDWLETSGRVGEEAPLGLLVAKARGSIKAQWSEAVCDRITALIASNQEEFEPIPISLWSLNHVITFLAGNAKLPKPSVLLTPAGNFRLEWRIDRQKFLGVEFLPSGRTKFVVFAPNAERPFATDRVSGVTSANEVLAKATAHGLRFGA